MPEQPTKGSRVVEIVRSDYQPSQAELEEDLSIDATPEELAQAILQPVTIKYIPRPKQDSQ